MYSVFISVERKEAMIFSYTNKPLEGEVFEKIKNKILGLDKFEIKKIISEEKINESKVWDYAAALDENGEDVPIRHLERLIMSGGVI